MDTKGQHKPYRPTPDSQIATTKSPSSTTELSSPKISCERPRGFLGRAAAGQGSSPAPSSWDACPSPLGRGRLGQGETAGPGAGAAGRAPPLAGVRFTEQSFQAGRAVA